MNKLVKIIHNGCFVVCMIGGTTSTIILITIIGLLKSCIEKTDPIDNSCMKQREMYSRHAVYDSTGVGFDLLWYTTKPVSEERAREIATRRHIKIAQEKFLNTAADHFNHDFFNTDIYDVVKYAKKFDIDPDVRLVNIFVIGTRLEDQYLLPNPGLPGGGCTTPYFGTGQGRLFLKEKDINPASDTVIPVYRYWECWRTSCKDERYTHFTEAERRQGSDGAILYIPKYNSQ